MLAAFKERNRLLRDNDIAVVKVEKKVNTRPPATNRQREERKGGQQRLSEIIHPIHYGSKSFRRQQQKKKAGRFRRSLSFSVSTREWANRLSYFLFFVCDIPTVFPPMYL